MKSSYQNKTSLFPNISSDVSDDDIVDFGNKIASTGDCLCIDVDLFLERKEKGVNFQKKTRKMCLLGIFCFQKKRRKKG